MSEFEKLLQENLVSLQRFVHYKINNTQDAEDIIQDVCLNATVKFASLKNHSSFKAWLIGIANHKIYDYYRTKTKNCYIPLDTLPEASIGFSRMGIAERNPVYDTFELLGDKEKQMLYLYYFGDLSQEEISKKLSIPIGTVKSRLHYAKEKFRYHYPYNKQLKGDNTMKKFPNILPVYSIKELNKPVFSVTFEELPNWFIIPKIGESVKWASYNMPKRNITEEINSRVVSKAVIHGVEGVEILTDFENKESTPHTYYAQLTDTHCRWLGESYIDKNGIKRLITFLDGVEFNDDWGYGEDNCGNETHLKPKGKIKRDGNAVSVSTVRNVIDVVGRYNININNKDYDTICVMEYFCNGALTEYFIDKNGRTILWRRFNKNDWANNRYKKLWTEMFPENQVLTVNTETYVHWYDSISDYII